jgi:hypothetical protein
VLLLLAVAVLGATYLFDWLAEPAYARLLAAVVAAVLGLGPALHLALVATRRWAAWTAVALALVWAAAWVWPTWRMVDAGEPAALAALGRGEDLRVAAAPAGGVTLQVRAEALLAADPGLAGPLGRRPAPGRDRDRDRDADGTVRYVLKVTDDAGRAAVVAGELSKRTVGGNRGGLPDPGATRTLVHGANLHTVPWPEGAPLRVHVTTLASPGREGALTVAVLPWALPWPLLWIVLALALVAAVVLDARVVPPFERCFLPHAAAVTLTFAVMVRDALAPLAPVKPLFGSLLVAALVGVVAGTALSWAGRKWLAGNRAGPTRGRSAAGTAAAGR